MLNGFASWAVQTDINVREILWHCFDFLCISQSLGLQRLTSNQDLACCISKVSLLTAMLDCRAKA